jgi:hypothetical protein
VFEDEDIKSAFPDYLDEDDQQMQITVTNCVQKLNDLIKLYKDEKKYSMSIIQVSSSTLNGEYL